MAYSGFVALGRLGSVFLLKALLGIFILFVYVHLLYGRFFNLS